MVDKDSRMSRVEMIPNGDINVLMSDRIGYFNSDNRLASDSALVSRAIEGREIEIVSAIIDHHRSHSSTEDHLKDRTLEQVSNGALRYLKYKYNEPCEQIWVDMACDHARRAYENGEPDALILSSYERGHRVTLEIIREVLADNLENVRNAVNAVVRLSILEAEIMSATIHQLKALHFDKVRTERVDIFRERIASEVSSASTLGLHLRGQASNASNATRGMLGKASEVAAAAEQSAVAMRDAAHTAAGLIRAIEDARMEVETAADVATRASEQAGEAVKVSAALSDTAKSIESILGLIRDVAGQTNLLALNATIEAARAGDAGRGFAVVAQEVKSLANQTARATDDIAAKIAAIQSATKSTVESNSSIRDTVAEVQASAHRIRAAMETQAQTVTMITAAVDETALAADTMSTTIAAIRQDTEEVASEIDALENGFDSVNTKLATLQNAAGDYVKLVA
jgi:methyl-accepting chemotaxis protein